MEEQALTEEVRRGKSAGERRGGGGIAIEGRRLKTRKNLSENVKRDINKSLQILKAITFSSSIIQSNKRNQQKHNIAFLEYQHYCR